MTANPVRVAGWSAGRRALDLAEVELHRDAGDRGLRQNARLEVHAEVEREQVRGPRGVGQHGDAAVRVARSTTAETVPSPPTATTRSKRGGVGEQLVEGALAVEVAQRDLCARGRERSEVVVEVGVAAAGARCSRSRASAPARPPSLSTVLTSPDWVLMVPCLLG